MIPSLPRQKIYKLHHINFIKDVFLGKITRGNNIFSLENDLKKYLQTKKTYIQKLMIQIKRHRNDIWQRHIRKNL